MDERRAVELINVTKVFRGPLQQKVVAVNDVTQTIEDGEFFSLLGPSGCGKTTTLRLIAGFELPERGEVLIGGTLQGRTPPYQRPVNTVFQNYALFPHMTVYENVAFGLEMEGTGKHEIKRRVGEALEMVPLSGMGPRKPKQLSGGQRQRIALARALIKRPAVLLLDEPLGALDRKLRTAMQIELKNLQEYVGITFVYVTHDQDEALTMSDRIAVMNQGRVLQVGPPDEIYEEPTDLFVADFIGESNFIDGTVTGVGAEEVHLVLDEGLVITAPVDDLTLRTGQRIIVMLRPEKADLLSEEESRERQNGWPGRVEEVIYAGTHTRYLIRLTEKQTIVVQIPNLGRTVYRRFETGDTVSVHWAPSSIRVFPGE